MSRTETRSCRKVSPHPQLDIMNVCDGSAQLQKPVKHHFTNEAPFQSKKPRRLSQGVHSATAYAIRGHLTQGGTSFSNSHF